MPKKSVTLVREQAAENSPRGPTKGQLLQQVDALQDHMQDVQRQLATQFQRIAAIQAQLDHRTAKRGNDQSIKEDGDGSGATAKIRDRSIDCR